MIKALVGCQVEGCAEEVSYNLDMVAMFMGVPICETCYQDGDFGERDDDGEPKIDWNDLPPVKLSDLSA